MNAVKAYERFREEVKREAAKLQRPLEISQSALWVKEIAVEAFDGKADGCKTVGAGETFGLSEGLVNQCIELAMRRTNDGNLVDDEWAKGSWMAGYNAARREFAEATGLYTDDY
jgi:hypothetical protein